MIIKDLSTFLDEKGEINLVERIRGTFRYGSIWFADMQAQELIIKRLKPALDDEFTLIRNLNLPGLDVSIPLILVGPPGVQVITASALKGIFQAKGEQWRVMNTTSRRFRLAKPNLVNRSLLLAQAVARNIKQAGFESVPVEPVVIFSDPGVHVDTKSPATRIVMSDAIDRFAASIATAPAVTPVEDLHQIVTGLVSPTRQPRSTDPEEERRIQEAFGLTRPTAAPSATTEITVPVLGSLRFTNRQWLILAAMVVVDVLVLAGLVLLTLFYN